VWETPLEDWRWVFDVNIWGVIHLIRSFVRILSNRFVLTTHPEGLVDVAEQRLEAARGGPEFKVVGGDR
jgi:NAD(P)-dependent dehydrogenase (short-subunit alcohol dehydrogenase family)